MNRNIKVDRSRITNRLWFLAGLAIFLLLSLSLAREIVNRRQIDRQLNDYREKIAKLNLENAALSDKVNNWNTSGELELNARVKLGLAKPGEKTIIVQRADSKDAPETIIKSNQEIINLNQAGSAGVYRSNPSKWRDYFFK
ncbi:MAG: septum formation initiator family protein [Patescibacteria group bacterium]